MKKTYSHISVNNTKVLCFMGKEFEEFKGKLESSLKNTSLNTFVSDLERLAQGKLVVSKDTKAFYNENKGLIDIIRKYSSLPNFCYTIINERHNVDPVYVHLLNNKDSIIKTIKLLDELEILGINFINFDETADFTKEIYKMFVITSPDKMEIVEKPEVIPGYEYDVIKYKTDCSPYLISVGLFNKAVIALNSLTFDKERLPKSLSKKDLRNELKGKRVDEVNAIRDSVDLSIGLDSLKEIKFELEKRVRTVKNEMIKTELINAIDDLNENLYLLELIIEEYDKDIETKYPLLTTEFLDKEKNAYEKRKKSHIW